MKKSYTTLTLVVIMLLCFKESFSQSFFKSKSAKPKTSGKEHSMNMAEKPVKQIIAEQAALETAANKAITNTKAAEVPKSTLRKTVDKVISFFKPKSKTAHISLTDPATIKNEAVQSANSSAASQSNIKRASGDITYNTLNKRVGPPIPPRPSSMNPQISAAESSAAANPPVAAPRSQQKPTGNPPQQGTHQRVAPPVAPKPVAEGKQPMNEANVVAQPTTQVNAVASTVAVLRKPTPPVTPRIRQKPSVESSAIANSPVAAPRSQQGTHQRVAPPVAPKPVAEVNKPMNEVSVAKQPTTPANAAAPAKVAVLRKPTPPLVAPKPPTPVSALLQAIQGVRLKSNVITVDKSNPEYLYAREKAFNKQLEVNLANMKKILSELQISKKRGPEIKGLDINKDIQNISRDIAFIEGQLSASKSPVAPESIKKGSEAFAESSATAKPAGEANVPVEPATQANPVIPAEVASLNKSQLAPEP